MVSPRGASAGSRVEEAAEHVAQRPSRRSAVAVEPAHQRAVAVGEHGEAGMRALAGELLVERDAPAQHAVEDVGGDPAGGEAGNFRLGGAARTRHDVSLCQELCPGREECRQNAARNSQALRPAVVLAPAGNACEIVL